MSIRRRRLLRHFQLFDDALEGTDHLVCYAMKAASNQAILKTLAQAGAGMDVVSGGEYHARQGRRRAPATRSCFPASARPQTKIRTALTGGIRQFNVESEPEMEVINAIALELGVIAPITVRVNPDVDAKTHAKIATGKSENKFGIPITRASEVYARAASLPGLEVIGIDVHIGSQLTELEPFELAYDQGRRIDRPFAGRKATISAVSIWAGAWAFPIPARTMRRRCRLNMAQWSSGKRWVIWAVKSRLSRAV